MQWMLESIAMGDIIDILLLSYIIYRGLLIIQGTRAVQSIYGLLILVLLFSMAAQFDLHSIYWLLDKFFVYFFLAIIILFQEDIRRGLARAGSLFPSMERGQDINTLEALIKISFELASRRIGAIIAIERKVSLNDYVESATRIDSHISHELLTAIFIPTSPLHDGAVIIQDDKISAAQSFLPLSVSKDISKMMGSRHRAAIGLTEKTDAIAIVVSEERGAVCIAQKGQLSVVKDMNEMRQKLQDAFSLSSALPDNEAS